MALTRPAVGAEASPRAGPGHPPASVVVRSKDRADTIERTLRALQQQTVVPEIVVVDSGSRDATVRIARRFCDALVEIRPEDFSYGAALNRGARVASAPVHFALSAHSVPSTPEWIERALGHYRNPSVGATAGVLAFPDGTPLHDPYPLADPRFARQHRFWGYSNHAGSWRAEAWQAVPFNEQLPAAEDREWSWRLLEAGWRIMLDPGLRVAQTHRARESWGAWYRRNRREMAAHVMFEQDLSYSVSDLIRDWVAGHDLPQPVSLRRRMSPRRAVGLAGRYAGARISRSPPASGGPSSQPLLD